MGIVIIALITDAGALSLGISPVTVKCPNMLAGSVIERPLTVVTSGNQRLNISVEMEGSIADWMISNETSFILEPKSQHKISIRIEVPIGKPPAKYTGGVHFKAVPLELPEIGGGQVGMAVIGGATATVEVEITTEQVIGYSLVGVEARDVEVNDPIPFTTEVKNTGNVGIRPEFRVDIIDKEGAVVKSHTHIGEDILSFREGTTRFSVPSDNLPVGSYTAEVIIFPDKEPIESRRIRFQLLPEGTLTISGKLRDITLSSTSVNVGDTVRIIGFFENIGKAPVSAKFKGEVYLNEKIQDTFESDEIEVDVGEKNTFESYFTPKKSGEHIIRGRVVYSKKSTGTVEAYLKVKSGYSYYIYGAGLILIILIAVILKKKHIV